MTESSGVFARADVEVVINDLQGRDGRCLEKVTTTINGAKKTKMRQESNLMQ